MPKKPSFLVFLFILLFDYEIDEDDPLYSTIPTRALKDNDADDDIQKERPGFSNFSNLPRGERYVTYKIVIACHLNACNIYINAPFFLNVKACGKNTFACRIKRLLYLTRLDVFAIYSINK